MNAASRRLRWSLALAALALLINAWTTTLGFEPLFSMLP